MKILILTEKQDMFYHILVEALSGLDLPVGHAQFPINPEDITSYDPDIIIHNCEKFAQLDYKNAINIGINETAAPNTFSYKNKNSSNLIKPFVKLSTAKLNDERYKSDVVYVGNPSMLPDCIAEVQQKSDVNFKILNNHAVPITQYCGSCTFDDYKKFFHMSKCSLVNNSDSSMDLLSFKLLDILYAEGNPVLHENDDQFLSDINDAMNGKSFRDNFISKQEVEEKHTNFNRMSDILAKVGLNKLSKMVLESRGK
jgi:hypothetical protein